MAIVLRILVGLIGLLSLLALWPHWFQVEGLAAARGIGAIDLVGRANVRADVGGVFLAIGLFALLSALRMQRHWVDAALLMVGATFSGRLVSLVLDGAGEKVWPPMMIELTVIAIFATARTVWGGSQGSAISSN